MKSTTQQWMVKTHLFYIISFYFQTMWLVVLLGVFVNSFVQLQCLNNNHDNQVKHFSLSVLFQITKNAKWSHPKWIYIDKTSWIGNSYYFHHPLTEIISFFFLFFYHSSLSFYFPFIHWIFFNSVCIKVKFKESATLKMIIKWIDTVSEESLEGVQTFNCWERD